MDYAKIFTLWIMANYALAMLLYAFKGDLGRALYWFFAIGITATSMFLVK